MKGKLCSLKLVLSLLLFVFLCSFLVLSSPQTASAASINIRSFDVRMSTGADYMWKSGISYNQYITHNGIPPVYVNAYQFYTSNVDVTGNFANIHFETNFVFSGPTSLPYIGAFVNLNYINMITCSASGSSNLSIRQSSITTNVTAWDGPAPTINGKNKTLTIYGDVVLAGLTTGNQNFVCMVGSNQYNFYSATGNNLANFYVEQQPTFIDFTTDETEALLNTQIEQNETIINNQETIINNMSDISDGISDVNDTLTDPTVEGDFTMPEIPAFGPVATIINNIIGIPQTFINSLNRSCQPLTGGPIPFTDQNITLPCFLPLMQSLGLNTVVASAENLLAMYIWVRIAIFIVRSVKKLRDPENDDEEYLDI